VTVPPCFGAPVPVPVLPPGDGAVVSRFFAALVQPAMARLATAMTAKTAVRARLPRTGFMLALLR
jgi:hypothetical protein